jgi:hypothetical protein
MYGKPSSLAGLSLIHRSVKMIGLFVTALVGVYTIEDLWDKFGDTKMTFVSSLLSKRWLSHLTYPSAKSSKALGCTHNVSHCRSYPRFHGFFQDSLLGAEPLWTWRRPDELTFPGQPRRK